MPLPLETDRLVLRAPEATDLAAFLTLCRDAEAVRHIGRGNAWTDRHITEHQQWKINHLTDFGYTLFTVIGKDDGAILGEAGIATWPKTGEPELCWLFRPDLTGPDLGAEAATAVLAYVTTEFGLPRILLRVHEADTEGEAVARRLGFRLEGGYEEWGRKFHVYAWSPAATAAPA